MDNEILKRYDDELSPLDSLEEEERGSKKTNITHNRDLMKLAHTKLKGNWGNAILASVIPVGISILANNIPILGQIGNFIMGGAFSFGIAFFFLSFIRGKKTEVELVFKGFSHFWLCFRANFLIALFTALWTLLLIIPGVIAAYSYAMTFYIMADHNGNGDGSKINALDAIALSKKIMKGHRWKLFCLGCRFIGWSFLCILTLGIGFFWLIPYMTTSIAFFYEDIKERNLETPFI